MFIILSLLSLLCTANDTILKPTNYFSQCLRHIQTVQELEKTLPSSVYEKTLDDCSAFMISAFDNFNDRHKITETCQFVTTLQVIRVNLYNCKEDIYNQIFLRNTKDYQLASQKLLRQEWEALPLPEKKFFEDLMLRKLRLHRSSLRKKNISLLPSNNFQLNYEILNQLYAMAQPEKPQIDMPAKTLICCAELSYFLFCIIGTAIIVDEIYHMQDPQDEICPKTWF
jgi:hypothetical protein